MCEKTNGATWYAFRIQCLKFFGRILRTGVVEGTRPAAPRTGGGGWQSWLWNLDRYKVTWGQMYYQDGKQMNCRPVPKYSINLLFEHLTFLGWQRLKSLDHRQNSSFSFVCITSGQVIVMYTVGFSGFRDWLTHSVYVTFVFLFFWMCGFFACPNLNQSCLWFSIFDPDGFERKSRLVVQLRKCF